ncbi:MAG: hypothetical protein ABH874_05390 [Methanobacteriota archaeon]
MKIIFELEDVLGRKIILTGETLEHILEKPEMLILFCLEQALKYPEE